MTEPQAWRTDIAVVPAAAAVAANAYLAWHLPGWTNVAVAAVLVAAAATVARGGAGLLLLVAVVLLTGQHSAWNLSALREPLPETVQGAGRLVSDPAVRDFDAQMILDVEGRRYQASVPLDRSAGVRSLLTGENVIVTGATGPLQGAPVGWVLSWHLAGRLKVSSIEPGPGAPPWYRVANSLRRTVQTGSGSLGRDRAPLYMGLVVGDDRGQSDLLQFRFGASGLTHLLAVSGQNVAFLLAVIQPLLTRLGPRSKLSLAAVMLGLFTLVTRGEPSVLRAVIMAGVAMIAVTTGRVASGVRILSVTVILLLLVDPLLVHSMGFQLSVSATLGLLVLARPIEERLPGPLRLRLPLAVTLAAQIATAPLILKLSGGLPAAATPANLLAVPPAGLVMMLGVTVGLAAGLIREPVASVLMWPADILVRWVEWVATTCSRLPIGVLGVVESIVAAAAVGLLLSRPQGRWRRPVCAVGVTALVLLCLPASPPKGATELVEGATLWASSCGGTVLVLGAGARADRVMEALGGLEVRHVDVVVIDGGRAVSRVAVPLREQFGVRKVLSTVSPAPASTVALGDTEVRVGGLVVSLEAVGAERSGRRAVPGAPLVRVESIGGECKF